MKCGKPYLIKGSGNYYFRYTEGNVRKKMSTQTSDYNEALSFIARFERNIGQTRIPTLLEELRKYQEVETNPKYKSAQYDGSHYTFGYARSVSYGARHLEEVIAKQCPIYLSCKLTDFSRRDAKEISECIVKEKGRCRTARTYQQILKVLFSEAKQDGIIERSPFEGQKNIVYEEKVRNSIPNEWIAWVISKPDLFRDTEGWAYFTILATTGMRRSELLALSTFQIKENIMNIDRAVQGTSVSSTIGLPKWGIKRTIYMSQTTQRALNSVQARKDGRFFYRSSTWVQRVFDELKVKLSVVDPEHRDYWYDMTAHTLRHSFNTNCIVAGANSMLVAEYCGWSHQGMVLDMQDRYTNFRTQHLKPIADCVDKIYTFNKEMQKAL